MNDSDNPVCLVEKSLQYYFLLLVVMVTTIVAILVATFCICLFCNQYNLIRRN